MKRNTKVAEKDVKVGTPRESQPGNGGKRPLRVLHLEDNPNDAELIRIHLESGGFALIVVCVQTRAEFLAAIEAGPFDLILSDFSLPSFDGKTALTLARRQCPETPFIFVSGTIGEEAAIEGLKNGATDYVVKNRLNRLVPATDRALRERQEQLQRKQAERNLYHTGELFRRITENVADLIAVLDLDGKWLYTSPSYHTILQEAAVRPGGDFFAEILPEDRKRVHLLFRETIQTGTATREEFCFLLPDRSKRYIESQFSAVRDENGAVVNVVAVSRDVTERRRTEERVRQIHAELEKTNEDLRRRNEEIQSFYHTLSHELKTPLTSAREFISIVMDGLAGPLNETQSEYLNIAREGCNQLRVCLNDLLDAARLDTGKFHIEFKPASLGTLIQQAVTVMSPVAAKKKIQLAKHVPENLPEVFMDSSRIAQVIANLLNNALKFTPEGGRITLQAKELPQKPDCVQVSVSDTGRGIPKDKLERIFDRLYQVKLGDATTEQGIGLGLYICRELVELHGGHIRVESEPGQGSTFVFEIPKQPRPDRSTVLVVDDDPSVLEAVRCALEKVEFRVVTAEGGSEALRCLKQKAPDVVVLDLEMPDIDGATALKEIRKTWGSLPVIIYTGYPDSDLMTRALESSPFTCLCKPCSDTQLIETVRLLKFQSGAAVRKQTRRDGPPAAILQP